MNKKLMAIILCSMLFAVTTVSAISMEEGIKLKDEKSKSLLFYDDWSGEFSGNIGYKDPNSEEPTIVGTISGYYKEGKRACFFEGNVVSQDETRSGTFIGLFNKNIIVGKITGEKGSLKIVGFIGFKQDENMFGGRFMSTVGPALYFWGNYLGY